MEIAVCHFPVVSKNGFAEYSLLLRLNFQQAPNSITTEVWKGRPQKIRTEQIPDNNWKIFFDQKKKKKVAGIKILMVLCHCKPQLQYPKSNKTGT